MTPTALLGMLLTVLCVSSVGLLVALLRGWTPKPPAASSRRRARATTSQRNRAAGAAAAGLLVLVLTRWPIAAIGVVALVWLWPKMFGAGKSAREHLEQLEAVTLWTESLRDSVEGAMGLEQAIAGSVSSSSSVIRTQLVRLQGMLRAHIPLPEALVRFADDFDDASIDLVVMALISNARLRGPGLAQILTGLAENTREELEMRRRVEEIRRSLRRQSVIICVVSVGFALGMAIFARDFVAPYSTPLGNLVLALVLSLFGIGFWWMRKASSPREAPRLLADLDQVMIATSTTGAAR